MMDTPLEFPSLSMDDWAPTAPMGIHDKLAQDVAAVACPWAVEMMGAACTIDTAEGQRLVGKLLQWDPSNHRCIFLAAPDYSEARLAIARLRLVALTDVMPPGSSLAALGWGEQAPAGGAVDFKLTLDGGARLQGVALSHVERPEGHYLARRMSAAGAFMRLFVPRRAVVEADFSGAASIPMSPVAGRAVPSIGRFEPISSEAALLRAIKIQADLPVRRLGDILVNLELITVEQLATVLSGAGNAAVPLGERLVRKGLVSPEGLQRALHLKMGYPLVDLRRYPVDRELLKRLPYERAVELDVLPLAQADGRVIVALDDPGRLPALKDLRFLFQAPLAAALPWSDPVRRVIPSAYGNHGVAGSDVGWFG